MMRGTQSTRNKWCFTQPTISSQILHDQKQPFIFDCLGFQVCIYIYRITHTHIYIYIYISHISHIYIYISISIYLYLCICVYMYICIYVFIYIYICIYKYIYGVVLKWEVPQIILIRQWLSIETHGDGLPGCSSGHEPEALARTSWKLGTHGIY